MRRTLLAGIDLGTTNCRCVLYDSTGREVASAQREVIAEYPRPAWAEMDPEVWWQSVVAVVRQAIDRSTSSPESIAGVGISGLMHAPVLLDDADQPLTPAILWMDQRCAPQILQLRTIAEEEQSWIGTMHTAGKLRWLADTCPNIFDRCQLLLLPKDYVRYRLTGMGGTDPSDASGTGLYDRERGWLWRLVDAAGVPRRLLPAISPSSALAGRVSPAAAAVTGLAPGTPVAVGAGDALCSLLGIGPVNAGEMCLYLGTAAWIARMGGSSGGSAVKLVWGGATSTTGAALRWTRDLLLGAGASMLPGDYDAIVSAAEAVSAGAEGLFCLPHLMGERGPTPDPLARGAFVGLTLRHGRAHLTRAVLEGTAFQLRRLIETRLPPLVGLESAAHQGVLFGGVAHSPFWTQLIADVTGLTLRVPEAPETGALGAAILAAEAIGLYEPGSGPLWMSRTGSVYQPRHEQMQVYQPLYERYCELDDVLTPWFQSVNGTALAT